MPAKGKFEMQSMDKAAKANNGKAAPNPYTNQGYVHDARESQIYDDVQADSKHSSQPEECVYDDAEPPPKDVRITIKSQDVNDDGDDADEDSDFEDLMEDEPNTLYRGINSTQTFLQDKYTRYEIGIWRTVYGLFFIVYAGYFAYAMNYSFGDEGSVRLLALTAVAVFFVVVSLLNACAGDYIKKCCGEPLGRFMQTRGGTVLKWLFALALLIGLVVYVVIDIALEQSRNLMSAIGIVVYIALMFVTSHDPSKVKWRPVLSGLLLQFVFAILILRTKFGFEAFDWLGQRVTEFLLHADFGSRFVFGDNFQEHFFAFKILPVVIFFSTMMSVLYYLGAMQVVIKNIAGVMQFTMGTTAAESLNAAGNIFVGQTEAPLLIRPLLRRMTNSEIMAVMTGGYATIAGGVLAAYILFGVPANHLLSASVMSAPAALAVAKLTYPESKKSKTTASDVKNMGKSKETNVVEAASNGASASIKLVANIAANLIAFLAVLDFVNGTLEWMGHRVGLNGVHRPVLTFQLICSYLLYPFAFVMGADIPDCRKVAELIGVKTLLNEFVAFQSLGTLIKNREILEAYNGSDVVQVNPRVSDDIYLPGINKTLPGGVMSRRSEVISTYALTGFANVGSIGIILGALGAMAPTRKPDMAKMVVRAMIAGNVACFLTACIAGIFYEEF